MDLVNRLKFFMESNDIAISQFADTCHIPRPTMSQILNGRNKKVSDELISKIHAAYPELSVLWLMFGEGCMTTSSNTQISSAENEATTQQNEPYISAGQRVEHSERNNLTSAESDSEKIGGNIHNSNVSPALPHSNEFLTTPLSQVRQAAETMPSGQAIIDFGPITSAGTGLQSDNTPPATDNTTNQFENPITRSEPESTNDLAKGTSSRQNSNREATNPNGSIHSSAINAENEPQACNISLHTSPGKRITNIVVFYSDNSFQSFTPASI